MYLVVFSLDGKEAEYELSDSRNSSKHLLRKNAKAVWIYDKHGHWVSFAERDKTGKPTHPKMYPDGDPRHFYAEKHKLLMQKRNAETSYRYWRDNIMDERLENLSSNEKLKMYRRWKKEANSKGLHSVWVVFRKSEPWPIRHIISCTEPSSERKVKSDYYRDFTRFADDCFRGFPDCASAMEFEKYLQNGRGA